MVSSTAVWKRQMVSDALLRKPDERLLDAVARVSKARKEANKALNEVESKIEDAFRNDRTGSHLCHLAVAQTLKWLGKLAGESEALEAEAEKSHKRATAAAKTASHSLSWLTAEVSNGVPTSSRRMRAAH
jgi:hypothetical protein